MQLSFIRRLTVAFALWSALPAVACTVVYGKDWAFASAAPTGWTSVCHTKAMQGTVITLWPSEQSPDQADVFIYATVSTKDIPSLSAFAKDEQSRFLQGSPKSLLTNVEVAPHPANVRYEMVAISMAPPGDREELVAYMEGPTAYFIVVMTARSKAVAEKSRMAFASFLQSFIPMVRE